MAIEKEVKDVNRHIVAKETHMKRCSNLPKESKPRK